MLVSVSSLSAYRSSVTHFCLTSAEKSHRLGQIDSVSSDDILHTELSCCEFATADNQSHEKREDDDADHEPIDNTESAVG